MRSLLLRGELPEHGVQCQARGVHTTQATTSLSTRRCPATLRETGRRRAKIAQGLLILLLQEGQLAQVVDVAQRMAALRVSPVGLPAVVDAHATVVGQDADGVGGLV